MTEDTYYLSPEGTVTEDMMRRALDVAQPHMTALARDVLVACPGAPPGVLLVSLLAFSLGRALTDSDDFAEIANGALDKTGARYRLQRRREH
jgi:hypothetical protein